MRKLSATLLVLVLLAVPAAASAQSSANRTHSRKGRIIGTLVGIGGGFALGVVAGLAWYDDAINSDRKVTTTAVLFSAAGGIGGYLLGNAIDKRSSARTDSKQKADLLPLPSKLPRLRRPPLAASPLVKGLFAPPPVSSGT